MDRAVVALLSVSILLDWIRLMCSLAIRALTSLVAEACVWVPYREGIARRRVVLAGRCLQL